MADPREAWEDEFRTCVARLVQVMRHHVEVRDFPPDITPLIEPVRHLAGLVDGGASTEDLREAADTVVDAYEWPLPPAGIGDEGPSLDPMILAAVERLRAAIDALDVENDE